MDRVTPLMLGMVAIAPCACSATTGAKPVAISHGPHLQRWQELVAEASRRFRGAGHPIAGRSRVCLARSCGAIWLADPGISVSLIDTADP